VNRRRADLDGQAAGDDRRGYLDYSIGHDPRQRDAPRGQGRGEAEQEPWRKREQKTADAHGQDRQ